MDLWLIFAILNCKCWLVDAWPHHNRGATGADASKPIWLRQEMCISSAKSKRVKVIKTLCIFNCTKWIKTAVKFPSVAAASTAGTCSTEQRHKETWGSRLSRWDKDKELRLLIMAGKIAIRNPDGLREKLNQQERAWTKPNHKGNTKRLKAEVKPLLMQRFSVWMKTIHSNNSISCLQVGKALWKEPHDSATLYSLSLCCLFHASEMLSEWADPSQSTTSELLPLVITYLGSHRWDCCAGPCSRMHPLTPRMAQFGCIKQNKVRTWG